MFKFLISIFTRTWFSYVLMAAGLGALFNRSQAVDDVLNESRPSGNYVYEFSCGLRPFDEGEFRRAAGYYKTLISSGPPVPLFHANLAFCQFYLRDVSKAVETYRKAIALDPDIYSFYFDLGYITMLQGNYTMAAQLFQQSRTLLPQDRQEFLRKFHISPKYFDQPSIDRDSLFIRRLGEDLRMIYVQLSFIYLQLKEYEKTLAVATEGIRFYPADPQLYYYAGEASLHAGLPKEAAVFFSKAIDLAPNYVQAYSSRARVMLMAGNTALYEQDTANAQSAGQRGGWQRPAHFSELHHWHDAILFFQLYR
ncbi:MAG: tetratricopeptide repeat protein [Candidatus Omnitrophica bacterium]|nr:tetratricopeptide repeat protein [Candidatus Omnitrophota bacterium]